MATSTETSLDRGYAWVVLASCVVMRMLVDGFWSSLGVLFVKWEEHFNVSASNTAVIGSTFMLILLSSAPIASALAHRLTYRVIIIGAGIIAFICLFALSLVTKMWQIYMIMPILGFGMGFTYQTSCIYFVYYFEKHYALANGFNNAAAGIGVLAFPPLMEILITLFGWSSALEIFSAVMANICVCGLLLRPSTIEQAQTKLASKRDDKSIDQESHQTIKNKYCRGSFLSDVAKDFDLSLFARVQFIFHALLTGILYGGIYGSIVYLVPYAIHIGVSNLKASLLMSSYGFCCLTVRLSPVGHLVDKKIISASTLCGLGFLVSGIALITIAFTKTFVALMVVAGVYGTGCGFGGSCIMLLVTQSAGSKEKAPGAAAWLLLQNGIGSLIVIFLTGFLYGKTGSYRCPMILCGVCVIGMGFIALSDPLLKRWQTRLDKRRNCHSTSSQCVYVSLPDNAKPSQV